MAQQEHQFKALFEGWCVVTHSIRPPVLTHPPHKEKGIYIHFFSINHLWKNQWRYSYTISITSADFLSINQSTSRRFPLSWTNINRMVSVSLNRGEHQKNKWSHHRPPHIFSIWSGFWNIKFIIVPQNLWEIPPWDTTSSIIHLNQIHPSANPCQVRWSLWAAAPKVINENCVQEHSNHPEWKGHGFFHQGHRSCRVVQ